METFRSIPVKNENLLSFAAQMMSLILNCFAFARLRISHVKIIFTNHESFKARKMIDKYFYD